MSCYNLYETPKNCEHVASRCKNLTKLYLEGYYHPIVNELVRNNPLLEDLTVSTNKDIFNILTVNCKRLKKIMIYVKYNEEVEVKNIFDVISALRWLTSFDMNGNFDCKWRRCKSLSYTLEATTQWTIKSVDNLNLFYDIGKYFQSTQCITVNDGQQLMSDQPLSVQALQNTLQRCSGLYTINIYRFMNPNALDMAECFKFVTPNLRMISITSINVSTIIQILKYCQTLCRASFEGVYDSMRNAEIKSEFQRTVRDYTNKDVFVGLSFAKNPQKYLSFHYGVFGGNLLHFLGHVDGIEPDNEAELDD